MKERFHLLRYVVTTTLTLAFVFFNGLSQNHFHQFTKSDGLPSQEIYDLHQDHNGLIWIATDRGIASFNGSFFNVYTTKDGLPCDVVFEFFPQEDGKIWCTTKTNELFYFHPDKLVFRSYQFNDKLKKLGVLEQRGLKVYKDGSIDFRSNLVSGYIHVSPSGKVISNLRNVRSEYWGPYYLQRSDNGYYHMSVKNNPGEKQNKFMDMRVRVNIDELGDTLIVSSYNGFAFLVNNKVIKKEMYPQTTKVLKIGTCKNQFWIASHDYGIVCMNGKGQVQQRYQEIRSATCFLEDKDGGIWIGSLGSGLHYKPPMKIQLITGTKNMVVLNLSRNEKPQLIFGTNDRLLGKFSNDTISTKQCSFVNPSGQFYSGINKYFDDLVISKNFGDYTVSRYSDGRNQLPLFTYYQHILDHKFKIVYEVLRGSTKLIRDAEYLGKDIALCYDNKLVKVDTSGNVLKEVELSAHISEFDVDGETVYCATRGKGLIILNKNLDIVSQLDTRDGLAGNQLFEVLIDGTDIWLGSDKGLTRIYRDGAELRISSLTAMNGLLEEEVHDVEILNEEVYIGTSSGIFHFKHSDWEEIAGRKTNIRFHLKKIFVNGKSLRNLRNLSYDQNEIELSYELISFEQKDGLSFRYKLVGLDRDWNETVDRKVVYKSLPPGEYKLIIQPMFNGVPRNEKIIQKISILPAFYNTWWFISLVILLIILATWAFIRFRVIHYNRELIREILRFLIKRLRPKSKSFVVRANGRDVRIISEEVIYAQSNGNYLNIYTRSKKIVIREKISRFTEIVPDPLEYVRVRRSVIVRKDKITSKNSETILVGETEIRVGNTYRKKISEIKL